MPLIPAAGTVATQRGFVVQSRQTWGNVSVGMLPVANFAHGHTYFPTKQPQRRRVWTCTLCTLRSSMPRGGRASFWARGNGFERRGFGRWTRRRTSRMGNF
jgi:hypothetical protein